MFKRSPVNIATEQEPVFIQLRPNYLDTGLFAISMMVIQCIVTIWQHWEMRARDTIISRYPSL